MCGIVGIIGRKDVDADLLNLMNDKLKHRGPDGEGIYIGANFGFGHRRLAIVDLSEAGHQPMSYMNRYVITYNGEIYNYPELRTELKNNGYIFTTHTDTEVILASYDCWGVDCLQRFNGMWAFVIYDGLNDRFFMSRDRFGKKPFYYTRTNNEFIFASEIKAILINPSFEAYSNPNYLRSYIEKGCREWGRETAFNGILRFDFASFFEGNLDDILFNFDLKKYWDVKFNLKQERYDEQVAKEYAKKYYDILEDAVRIRMRADVKLGTALSGGLDSSSIVYLVNNYLKKQGKEILQETFSSVYRTQGTEDCDESEFINIVANSLGVHSNQIEPNVNDIPNEHVNVIYALENPPNNTLMSSWYTYKLVQQAGVTVTLDGQGADELLAGYVTYLQNYIASLSVKEAIRESKLFYSIPGAKKYVLRGLVLAILKVFFGKKPLLKILNDIIGKSVDFDLNKILENDVKTNLVTLLHYADHTAMAHSVESRMPFMDYRLVEFLSNVPACYKMHNGWTKYLARLAFDGKLPDDICWRRDKLGWPIPEAYWFSGLLNNWFLSVINRDSWLEGICFSSASAINEINEGKFDKAIRIMNLKKWCEVFFIKN